MLRREAWSSFEVSVGNNEEGEVVNYLHFIANFSNIFKPITSLTERNRKYEWGTEREEAFQTLKNDLCIEDKILATSSETPKETTDKVVVIKEKLQTARDRQKSYADSGHKMTEYEVGENVLLKVSPWKGVMRFEKKGMLAPRYVGPFQILKRIGPVAYQLRLLEELIGVHDTFHVSNLKKCLGNANLHVPLNEIKNRQDFTFC
ncbi:hypothetical protein Tco_1532480 [Tanacetum coccineum]